MGLANSRIVASQIGFLDTPNSRPTTPSSSGSSILLDSDPRSPSEEIVRTPILVDGSSPDGSLNWETIDPRSPSTIIERTPAVGARRSIQDPRSPTERIPRTPLEKIEECFFQEDLREEPSTPSTDKKTELSFKILDETPKDDSSFQPKRLFKSEYLPGQRVPFRSANRPSSLRLRAIQQHSSFKQATVAPSTCDPAAECTTNAWCIDKENSPATTTMQLVV